MRKKLHLARFALMMNSGGAAGYTPDKGANLAGWGVADDVTGADGAAVSAYTDSVGIAYTQPGAAGIKPTKKTNIVNGHSVLRFDGGDYLIGNALAAHFDAEDTPWCISFVAKYSSLAALGVVFGVGNSGSVTPNIFLGADAANGYTLLRRSDASAGTAFMAGTPDTTDYHIITMNCAGTSYALFVDGLQVGADKASDLGTITLDLFTIGALIRTSIGSYFTGDIAEWIIRSAASDETLRIQDETYLASRYNITVPFYNGRTDLDVFIIAGQSNASGRGTNNQTITQAGSYLYTNAYTVKHLTDPTDSSAGQVDAVSSDAASAAGSVWPLISDTLVTNTGKALLFVPCALGGSSISDWQPGANHQDRTTLYGSMIYRALQAASYGNLQSVLWWQGETDALNGTAQAAYNASLDALANAVFADLGIKLMPCKLQTCAGADVTAVNAAIAEAWADNANILTGPDLSALASDDDWHLKTDAKLLTAAGLWVTAIETAMGW